jgi:hypothetical protein
MRKEVPPGAIVAATVALVLVLGYVAYAVFGGNPAATTATRGERLPS